MIQHFSPDGSQPKTQKHFIPRHYKHLLIGISTLIVTLTIGSAIYTLIAHGHKQPPSTLPPAVLKHVSGFKAYYFKSNFTTGYKLIASSVKYQNGVLIFGMKNASGKTLAFTEEATPPGFSVNSLRADKQFDTSVGQAFITDGAIRTTGALFTTDHTWVLVNAPQAIGADLMQQILDNLTAQ
jgi:hypothetical protein